MLTRVTDWLGEMRALWTELGRIEQDQKAPVMAQITYYSPSVPYGRLGEMGHPDDRADDWGPANTGVRPSPRDPTKPSN